MSFVNANGMSAADLAAVVGNNDGTFGNGGDGWLFLLFILLLWGNNGNGINNSGYPAVQQGFDQAAIISGIQSVQTAVTNGQFEMMSSLQNCCCDNRLATANLGASVASESCATRQAITDGLRDLMAQNVANTQLLSTTLTQGFQGLHDEFCQSRLDAKNEKIADLQRQVEEAQDNARYNGIIAAFNASQEAQTTAIEQYLNPTARPCYVVPNPNGCGCACNQY